MQSESLDLPQCQYYWTLFLFCLYKLSLILRLCRKKKFAVAWMNLCPTSICMLLRSPLRMSKRWVKSCRSMFWCTLSESSTGQVALAIFCVFSDTFYHGSGEGECLLVIEVAVGAASLQVTFAVKIIVVFFWWWHFQRCRVVYFSI